MRHALIIATALVLGGLATTASAETPEERQACQDDAFRRSSRTGNASSHASSRTSAP